MPLGSSNCQSCGVLLPAITGSGLVIIQCPHCHYVNMTQAAQPHSGYQAAYDFYMTTGEWPPFEPPVPELLQPKLEEKASFADIPRPPADAPEWACPSCGGDMLYHTEAQRSDCVQSAKPWTAPKRRIEVG